MARKASAKGSERKTPHVQRSPYRRIMTALRHQVKVTRAAFDGAEFEGKTGVDASRYYSGFIAGLEAAMSVVDLVFFSDHSNRRGRDGA